MKFFKLFLLFAILTTASCKNGATPKTGIIPQPNNISYQEGTFLITAETKIVAADSKEGRLIAEAIQTFLVENFNLSLKVTTVPQTNAIQLILSAKQGGKEAYELAVSKTGVLIRGNDYNGIFYGVQSLKQLLTPKTILKNHNQQPNTHTTTPTNLTTN